MKVKWSKKKAIECITELRSPFEEVVNPPEAEGNILSKLLERLGGKKPVEEQP